MPAKVETGGVNQFLRIVINAQNDLAGDSVIQFVAYIEDMLNIVND